MLTAFLAIEQALYQKVLGAATLVLGPKLRGIVFPLNAFVAKFASLDKIRGPKSQIRAHFLFNETFHISYFRDLIVICKYYLYNYECLL